MEGGIPSGPHQVPVPTAMQASGGGEPLGGAYALLSAPFGTIDRLGTALDNLTLLVANDTTVLQQRTAANLALTATNALLMTANKKLSEALAKLQATKLGQQTISWQLLLDSRLSCQPDPHKCHMRRQGRGLPGHGDGFQHDGREQEE